MSEVLIKVDNVSKKFAKNLKKSLFYGFKDVLSGLSGKSKTEILRNDEFWAVHNVSFEVKRGECLGLIGHNGAGKSTLLKMLNGLIVPDTGTITMRGKIGALIELGAGFNPILTGRENIYNNGAVIGFSKAEIKAKFDAIVAFAELDEFIDMPVQNYSSGMRVRLGFAIAAQMEPDILLIDEVLAVGDLGFILKCFKRIDQILPHTAVIFVSHSMPMVSRISNQILLMDHGKTEFLGTEIGIGIGRYYNKFSESEQSVVFTDDSIEVVNCEILNLTESNGIYHSHWNNNITFKVTINNKKLKHYPMFSFAIYDIEQRGIAELFPSNQNVNKLFPIGEIELSFDFKNVNLSKGVYSITIGASLQEDINPIFKMHNLFRLQIEHPKQIWTSFLVDSTMLN